MKELRTVFDVNPFLKLRELNENDASNLFALIDSNRAHLRRWLPWVDGTTSIFHSESFIKHQREQRVAGKALTLGVIGHEKLIGILGTHQIDWANHKTSLGYWLGESSVGQGLILASCRVLIDYLFSELNLHRITISCGVDNRRSCAVAESLNFQAEGTLVDNEYLYDRYVTHTLYACIRVHPD